MGAGPTGLTLAVELLRHGVRPRLVDRADGPRSGPRALGLQVRALEIARGLGVERRWLTRGQWCTGFRLHAGGRVESDVAHDLDHLDAAREGTLFLDQTETEAALRERLRELGGRVEWRTSFRGAHDRGHGFGVLLDGPDGPETLHADWLVGADGARSPVRDALGLGFPGGEDVDWLVAEVEGTIDLSRTRVHMCRTPHGNAVLFPFGPGERWSVVDTEPPAREPETDEERRALAAAIERRVGAATGRTIRIDALPWVSRFTIPSRHATAMRAGRGLIAGDAAHIHSPASGRGMNGGIEDAVALGWRLAAVLRGEADARVLDGYEAERLPAARRLLRFSWAGTRMIEEKPTPLHAALGALIRAQDAVAPLHRTVARFYTGEMSGLVDGTAPPRLALPGELARTAEGARLLDWAHEPGLKVLADGALATALPPHVAVAVLGRDLPDPDGALAAALRLGAEVVLVRPDGREAARCRPEALPGALAELGVRRGAPIRRAA